MDRASLYVSSATGVDVALPVAGAGSRSYAFLIDWHIRILLALAWFLVAAIVAGRLPTRLRDAGPLTVLIGTVPPIAIYLLYHPVLEIAMHGRTPGKRMAGIRIVARDGGTPSVGALLVRNVFRLVDMLPVAYLTGLIATLMTRDHVRVGDMAAGTLLVHDRADSVAALASLAGVAQDTAHDPALIDLGQDLMVRWPELAPGRREPIARSLLLRLGVRDAESIDDAALLPKLRAALGQPGDPL